MERCAAEARRLTEEFEGAPPDTSVPPAEPPEKRCSDRGADAQVSRFLPRLLEKRRDPAVAAALDWLARHQSEDGRWDGTLFASRCQPPGTCAGAGRPEYTPGLTGLSLLSFLAAGETSKRGRYREQVRAGLKYLRSIQDPQGCIGPRTAAKFTYNHAIGALALVEAYRQSASGFLKLTAQAAVDFVGRCQNPYLAWRYGVRPGDNDTSVSGWMFLALYAAKAAGLEVGEQGFDGMKAWLEKVTEPDSGRVGYTVRGSLPHRRPELADQFPADRSESLTAIGIFCRILNGEEPRRSEPVQRGTENCLKCLPVWDENIGSIDFYYWHFGTLAMYQVGGDAYLTWRESMKTALLDNRRRDGCSSGSWDPVDPWGREGGRVYSTAMAALTLLAPGRYPSLYPEKRAGK